MLYLATVNLAKVDTVQNKTVKWATLAKTENILDTSPDSVWMDLRLINASDKIEVAIAEQRSVGLWEKSN